MIKKKHCKVSIMLLLPLFTFTHLLSCSLGVGVDYVWGSWENLLNDVSWDEYKFGGRSWQYSSESSSDESTPHSYAPINIVAEFKNSETPSACPPGESLMSKKDIIVLINYLQSELNIIDDINKIYVPAATNVSANHLLTLNEIETRVTSRPEHLKNILQDIDATRMKLEPIVDAIVAQLQEYTTYENKLVDVNERGRKVLEPLEKYKQLCKFNNCAERKLVKRQNNNPLKLVTQKVTDADYYCTSLEQLHKRISTSLITFQHDYVEFITHRLSSDNEMYIKKIDNIRSKVKESAISMFGVTMYEILSLQDDYHNYAKELNTKDNVTIVFNSIRKDTLEIEFKLIDLEEDAAKYHQYCLNCKPQQISRMSFKNEPENNLKPSETTSLLQATDAPSLDEISLNIDNLIKVTIDGYKRKMDNNYGNIFSGLDKVVNNPTLIDSYVKNLKPVQDMVRNELVVRQEALNNLKSKLQQSMVVQVCELEKKSKQLLDAVQSAIVFVKKYVQ